METKELLNKIISQPKFYLGVMKQSKASRTVKRIKNGSCSIKKRDEFFNSFGYNLINETWE